MALLLTQHLLSDYLKQVDEKSKTFGTLIIQGPRSSGIAELKEVLSKKYVCKEFSGEDSLMAAEDGLRVFFSEKRIELSPELAPDIGVLTLKPVDIDSLIDYMISLFSAHNKAIPNYERLSEIYKSSHGFPSLVKLKCGEILSGRSAEGIRAEDYSLGDLALSFLRLIEESSFLWSVDWCDQYWPQATEELFGNFLIEKKEGNYRVSDWGRQLLLVWPEAIEFESLIDQLAENHIEAISDPIFKFRLTLQMALWNKSAEQLVEVLSYNTRAALQMATKPQLGRICSVLMSKTSSLESSFLFLLAEVSVEYDPKFSLDLVAQLKLRENDLSTEQILRLNLLNKRLGYASHSENPQENFVSYDEEGSEAKALRLYEQGLALRRKGYPEESTVKLLEACELTLIPTHRAEFLYAMGVSHILNASYEEAVARLEEAQQIYKSVENHERSRAAQFNKAVAYENMGEVDYAISLMDKLMQGEGVFDALSASLHNFLGQIEYKKGQFSQSLQRFQNVLGFDSISPSQRVIALETRALSHCSLGLFDEAESDIQKMYELITSFELDQLLAKALYVDLELALKRKNTARVKVLNKRIKSNFDRIPKKYRLLVLQRLFVSEVELFSDSGLLDSILEQVDQASEGTADSELCADRNLLKGIYSELKGEKSEALMAYKESLRFSFRKRLWSRLEDTVPRALKLSFALGKVGELEEFLPVLVEKCKGAESLGFLLVYSLKYNHTLVSSLAERLSRAPNLDVQWRFLLQKLQAKNLFQPVASIDIDDGQLQAESIRNLIEVCKGLGVSLLEECLLIQRAGARNEVLTEKNRLQWKSSGLFVDAKSKMVFFNGHWMKSLSKSPLLFKLLGFFVENHDSSHTKEEIISYVWREKYDPQVHDSLIYVSLHRLKKVFADEGIEINFINSVDDNYRLNSEVMFSYVTEKHQFNKCLSQRQLWVLNYLKYNNKINNQALCKLLDIAPRTALRDLSQMVDTGYLMTEGKGKSLKYVLPA